MGSIILTNIYFMFLYNGLSGFPDFRATMQTAMKLLKYYCAVKLMTE